MKLSAIFLLIFFMQVSAKSLSQVTISLKDVSVEKVLREVERQTGVGFLYTRKMIKDLPHVTINVKNVPVTEVLGVCFSDQELEYFFDKNTIVITKKAAMPATMLTNSLTVSPPPPVEIHGRVTDQQGNPLANVSVIVSGTSVGTTTNADGRFSITAPDNRNMSLEFSSVGFVAKKVAVGNQTEVNVVLETANTGLDEVVIVGYGTQKKGDLTGAISSISARDFENEPLFRIEDVLIGRATGVQVTKNSGVPGADLKIRIRGSNSINGNNQPLVVIDGVIGSDLRSISTSDIASMEILKDASATAVYGSRGSNGVIIITTKRGEGVPLTNLDYFASIAKIVKKIDLLSPEEFAKNNNIQVINGGTDYQDAFFQSAYTHNLEVSHGGKKDRLGYFVSGNVLNQTGSSINTNYKRYSLRSNLDAALNDKLSVQLNIYGSSERALNLFSDGAVAGPDDRGGIQAVLGWDPTLPVKDDNGNYNFLSNYGSTLMNPIAQRLESSAHSSTNSVKSNINLSYKIIPHLSLTILGGVLYDNLLKENYFGIPSGTSFGLYSGASGGGNVRYRTTLQNSNILTWDKSIKAHFIKVTGLFENQKIVTKGMVAGGGEYIIPGNFYSLDLGTQPNVSANFSTYQIQSWMGRAEYNFHRKLFLTGTVRADISSKFRKGKRTGIFPSSAAAYKFSDLLNGKVGVKVRAGYGEVGNEGVPPYITYSTLSSGQNYPLNGREDSRGVGLIGGNVGNADLTWETTRQTNIGADFTFLEGDINITIDRYWKNTFNLLLDVPLADYLGGGAMTRNVGKVNNRGWEVNFQSSPVKLKNFNWGIELNYSYNHSECLFQLKRIPVIRFKSIPV